MEQEQSPQKRQKKDDEELMKRMGVCEGGFVDDTEEVNYEYKKSTLQKPPYGMYWRFNHDDMIEYVKDKNRVMAYFSYFADMLRDPKISKERKTAFWVTQLRILYFMDSGATYAKVIPLRDLPEEWIYLQEDDADPFELWLLNKQISFKHDTTLSK